MFNHKFIIISSTDIAYAWLAVPEIKTYTLYLCWSNKYHQFNVNIKDLSALCI